VILKDRGGQTSLLQRSVAARLRGGGGASSMADDQLLPDALAAAVMAFGSDDRHPSALAVAWDRCPWKPYGGCLPERTAGKRRRAGRYSSPKDRRRSLSPPQSGIVWRTTFLQEVVPIPEFENDLGVGVRACRRLALFTGHHWRQARTAGAARWSLPGAFR